MKENKAIFISVNSIISGLFIILACSEAFGETPMVSGTGVSVGISASAGVAPARSEINTNPLETSAAIVKSGTQSAASFPPGVIARIGDTDVKVQDLSTAIAALAPEEKAELASNPDLFQRVVRSLLVEQIVLKEAAAKQWDTKPEVAAHLDRLHKTAEANFYLKEMSKPADDYPSKTELQSAYDARKESLSVPHQFHVAQIFIRIPQGAAESIQSKAKIKLEAIIDELNKPDADFAKIARNESDEQETATSGGDMGWVFAKSMPPRIYIRLLTLGKNKVSEPIRIEDGWHILKLLDSKDIFPIPLGDVKMRLTQELRAERSRTNLETYVSKLLQQYPVTVDDKSLPELMDKPEK